jgi:uncharacterized FlaG/YvyC family protein
MDVPCSSGSQKGNKKKLRNVVASMNEKVGQTNTRKEEKVAEISTDDAIRQIPRQFKFYQSTGRRDLGVQRRRWLDIR